MPIQHDTPVITKAWVEGHRNTEKKVVVFAGPYLRLVLWPSGVSTWLATAAGESETLGRYPAMSHAEALRLARIWGLLYRIDTYKGRIKEWSREIDALEAVGR